MRIFSEETACLAWVASKAGLADVIGSVRGCVSRLHAQIGIAEIFKLLQIALKPVTHAL
jgi:hypothetical protein